MIMQKLRAVLAAIVVLGASLWGSARAEDEIRIGAIYPLTGSTDGPVALRHGVLHHRLWNVAPDRVRHLDHSLKRDIDLQVNDPHADSPMSMTQPTTTLTRGHCATLLLQSSPAPRSTLLQSRHWVFLRHDLRIRPDYFAKFASLNGAHGDL